MERGSTQHGPRLDEELAQAAEGLVHAAFRSSQVGDLDPEAPDTGEVDITVGPSDESPTSLDHAAVIERSELARWLRPSAFPGTPVELREVARGDDAPAEIIGVLDALDPRTRYETFGDLWGAAGGATEPPRDTGTESATPTGTDAPDIAGPLVTAVQLATFPVRLTLAVAREAFRLGRRIVGRN
jgi:hypothetical protein